MYNVTCIELHVNHISHCSVLYCSAEHKQDDKITTVFNSVTLRTLLQYIVAHFLWQKHNCIS